VKNETFFVKSRRENTGILPDYKVLQRGVGGKQPFGTEAG
jgi:hypothetical protein